MTNMQGLKLLVMKVTNRAITKPKVSSANSGDSLKYPEISLVSLGSLERSILSALDFVIPNDINGINGIFGLL